MDLNRMNTDEQLQAALRASLQTHQQESIRRSKNKLDYIASTLPSGWEQRKDPKSGRVFYIDHNTRQTHWEPPDRPLPPGWERKLHQPSGRYFYIDHNTRATSWDPPEIPEDLFNQYQEQSRVTFQDQEQEQSEEEEDIAESPEEDMGPPRKTSTDFDKECCICFDADVNVMTPCFHKFCRDCAEQLDECALCRKPYTEEELMDLRFTKRSIVQVPTYADEVESPDVQEQHTFHLDGDSPAPANVQPAYNPHVPPPQAQQPVYNPYAPQNQRAPPALPVKREDNGAQNPCCSIS